MSIHRRSAAILLSVVLTLVGPVAGVAAQESKPTIRHHRVAEEVPDDSSSPEVAQAETAMQHGEFATAESLLQKAITAKPNDYRAWFDLGYVYNATQRSAQAIDAYRKSVAAKPDVFESNLNLGILLAGQGDKVEAAQYLKAATQLKPTANPEEGLARAWQSLGHVEEDSDPQQALAAYSEAAKLNPKSAQPHLSAGILLEKRNDLDAAAREFQLATDLDPISPEALAGLANVAMKQKKYPEAEAALRKLLASRSPEQQRAGSTGTRTGSRGQERRRRRGAAAGTKIRSGRSTCRAGTRYAVRTGREGQRSRATVSGRGPEDAPGRRGALRAGFVADARKEVSRGATGIAACREAQARLGGCVWKSCRSGGGKQELCAGAEGPGLSCQVSCPSLPPATSCAPPPSTT